MADGRWRHNGGRVVLGVVVICLGILFTLDKLGYVEAGTLWDYWPVLLIAAGVGRFLQPRACRGRGVGAFLIVLGVWFLLNNLDVIPYRLSDYWPVLLVVLGAAMVWRAFERPGVAPACCEPEAGFAAEPPLAAAPTVPPGPAAGPPSTAPGIPGDPSARVDCFALLGASRRRSVSQDFRGGSLTAIMGGCELDLRQASIRGGEAVLDTFAIWGGIEVKVPQDWTIALHGTPILGAFEDKTARVGGDGSKVLVVTGTAIMGGIEIKN